jgi:hypothetical protein
MWITCINISTIQIKISQDTLIKLITAVINICYPAIGLFLPLWNLQALLFETLVLEISDGDCA